MQLTEHWGNTAKFSLHNDKTGGLRFELSATCQYGTYYSLLQQSIRLLTKEWIRVAAASIERYFLMRL